MNDAVSSRLRSRLAGGDRSLAIAVALLAVAAAVLVVWYFFFRAPDVTIGVEGVRVVEIQGAQLVAAPFTPGDAVSLRIAEALPTAGGYRYDLRYIPYGPGEHDLAEHLVTIEGRRPADLPKIVIETDSLLPKNHKGELYASPTSAIDLHSKYTLTMRLLWALWGMSLVPLLVYGHRRRKARPVEPPPPTIEERLRGLLERAAREKLSVEEQVDLERLLAAYWSERLGVDGDNWSDVLDALRKDPKADKQLSRIERWLHSRATTSNGEAARELLADLDASAGRSKEARR
jgi:hypothetical protein